MNIMTLKSLKSSILSAAFLSFQYSGLQRLFSASSGGLGVIFMLHRVLPEHTHNAFAPHKYLSITPEFLAQTIDQLRAMNIDIVSIDEALKRIISGPSRKFAVFTFDDGFQDILTHAFPVFKAKSAPMTLYIPSSWPAGEGLLYWMILENIVAQHEVIKNPVPAFSPRLVCKTLKQKNDVFQKLLGYFEAQSDLADNPYFKTLLQSYTIDPGHFCRQNIMSWETLRALNQDELVTIGAHSMTHPDFHTLSDHQLNAELTQSRLKITQELGQTCQHLAYPFGDKRAIGAREISAAGKAGYHSALTTRKGVVQTEHQDQLMALPRIHLHHDYQSKGYVSLVTSGMPYFILNRFRRHVAS